MGSYYSVKLAGYELECAKSYIGTFWACLFNEKDRRIRLANPDDEYLSVEYAAPAKAITMRLEILGYTLEKVEKLFVPRLETIIEKESDFYKEHLGDHGLKEIENLVKLKNGGFSNWLTLAREIIKENLEHRQLDRSRDQLKDNFRVFLVDSMSEDMFLGYPSSEIGYCLRALLEAVSPDDELILDITDLTDGGYYYEGEPVCENVVEAELSGVKQFQKIIILTEGTSDSDILSNSLPILYPEVSTYFSFMDFENMNSEGGTSALERTVKSFAAAGIHNKIIALFDNDAAGVAASKRLTRINLPKNIRILTLPYLDIGSSYPTIGPQGVTIEDVNGRACSIEMYLGTDVLSLEEEKGYIPIQWRNFESQINVYQGEISKKAIVQARFKNKIALAKQNLTHLNDDWSGIQLIFQSIFKAAASL